jgi:hypothetical protein
VAEDQGPEIVKDPGKFEYGKYKRKEIVKDSDKLDPLTPKKFNELTPQKELQDATNTAMLTTGSIFTHDTHTEQALWDIWEEQKPFFTIPEEGTVGVEGEKQLPLTEDKGDSTDFAPQLEMFGNQPDLMAPVPVIDVSPTAPAMGANAGMIPSELLAQSVSQISAMEKQAVVGSPGGNNNINTNSSVDNSVTNFIPPPSSAHAGIIKAGSGRG